MLNPEDLILVLHDGARSAERRTLSAVLDDMADSLTDLLEHRQRGDGDYRSDELRAIYQHGSRAARQR